MVLKRKVSPHNLCIETKKTNANVKKNQTKADLLKEFKTLQKINEALEEENKNQLESIAVLEAQVSILETAKLVSHTSTQEIQTFANDLAIPCQECIYIATCEEELNWHMSDAHNQGETDYEPEYPCTICGRNCETKVELMIHKKQEHEKTVKICKYFQQGKCAFDDTVCWYNHSIRDKCAPQSLSEFKCNICGKIFKLKCEFMKHRKLEHNEFVEVCRYNKDNFCRFKDEECWFKHSDIESLNKSTDIVQKLFTMMEKFSERVQFLENQI